MIKFGTGGWRAVIADGFTKENIRLLSQGFCNMIKDGGKEKLPVVIGYDRRFLSKEAAGWIGEVVAGNGIVAEIIDGESPTPLIMFTVKEHGLEYGMAVTASHNPAIYNGIKIFTKGGRDAKEEITNEIEGYIEKLTPDDIKSLPYAEAKEQGLIKVIFPQNEYIDSILALVDVNAIKNARLRVVLDPMYGVSQTSVRTIFLTMRCDVDVIHERHDTLFGGRLPAPNEKTLGALSNYVVENNYDLGIATDGDADRIGVVDDKGVFVHPNKLLVILYYYLLEYRGLRGPAVRNNSTSHLLDKVAAHYGETCYEVPVGFKHISSKMEETNAIIGGESSGGLTVRGHISGKDGIYAAALLAELMAVTKKRFSDFYKEITDKFGELFISDLDVQLESQEKKTELQEVIYKDKVLPEFPFEIDRISYLDGCKVYFKNGGWIIARFSGTEPLLRLCCEMDNKSDAERCIELFRKVLRV